MMKYFFYGIILLSFAGLGSCKKSSADTINNNCSSVTGKWNYAEYYVSDGVSAINRLPVTPGQFIDLEANGTFSSNFAPFDTPVNFQLVASAHMKFNEPSAQGSHLYFYGLNKNELQLSPADPGCIEGCAQKFTR
jgi:hypothetical protein